MNNTEETSNIEQLNISTESEKSYNGLAYCHNEEMHITLEKIFPQLEGIKIKWTYIDINGIGRKHQIIGSIYEPNTLRKAYIKCPKGYDYIILAHCPMSGVFFEKYSMISTLTSAQILLREGGILIFQHFPTFAIKSIDELIYTDTIESKQKIIDEENISPATKTSLSLELYESSKVDRVIFLKAFNIALKARIERLLNDDYYMNNVVYPYINNLCQSIGFTSYEYSKSYIYFYK